MNKNLATGGGVQGQDSRSKYIRRLRAKSLVEAKAMTRSALEERVAELEVKLAHLLETMENQERTKWAVSVHNDVLIKRFDSDKEGRQKGGKKAHEGTAKIKEDSYKVWLDWQAGKRPEIGDSQAAFGRFIERIYEDAKTTITARQVSTVWCPKWRKLRSAS